MVPCLPSISLDERRRERAGSLEATAWEVDTTALVHKNEVHMLPIRSIIKGSITALSLLNTRFILFQLQLSLRELLHTLIIPCQALTYCLAALTVLLVQCSKVYRLNEIQRRPSHPDRHYEIERWCLLG